MRARVRHISVVSVAACLLIPAPALAHPPKPVGAGGRAVRGTMHGWLHQARAPLVRGRVQILVIGCPARPRFVACVYSRRPSRIYIRPGLRNMRWALYHELGHVFDFQVLNNRERRRFRQIMGIRENRWFGGRRRAAELFSEGYASCARFGPKRAPRRRSVYGYAPTARQHRATCRLLRRAAAPRGRRPQPPPKPPRVIGPPPSPPADSPAGGGPPPHSSPPPRDESLLDVIFDPMLR